MTPPDDVSTRLSEIRERVEAATEGPWRKYHGGDRWSVSEDGNYHNEVAWLRPELSRDAEFVAAARSDVPYLLSLVEDIGEGLAEFSIDHMDEEVLAPLEQAGRPDLATVLAQVRDVALQREYDAALRDAAQEGAE